MDIKNSDQQPEGQAADAGSSGDDGGSSSLGAHLRRAREARGYTLRDLEDRTRISRRYLEAIELNDYKQLPGGIFNRSFIKAYAKQISFDEEEAMEGYLRTAREQGDLPHHGRGHVDDRARPDLDLHRPAHGTIPRTRTTAAGLGTSRSARSLPRISDPSRSKSRERSSSISASWRRTSTTSFGA